VTIVEQDLQNAADADRGAFAAGRAISGPPLPEVLPLDARLEELFAAQAARSPQAVAVAGGGERWTYRDLAERATRVAGALRRRGLGPGARVGIFAERRPAIVAAILGTLEAGCAYVPLDPEYPAERLRFMLGDSGAGAVLAQGDLAPRLGADAPPVVEVDEAMAGEAPAGRRVRPADGAARLAYLIYTSGSTGRPKGVAIEHRSATALLAWASTVFSADELAAVLASTSICFDLSVFELFLPLSRGGTVVLVRDAAALAEGGPDGRLDPEPTLINTVPSAIDELLRAGAVPRSVRTVNLAGEPLRRDLVERIHDEAPWVERVLNLYGPSEDTTYSTWSEVEPGAGRPVTIGRPVAGTRAHVLDPDLRPAGPGEAGELCLAGAGLARGYHRRPARTAAAFVPDPFAGPPGGGRLYRTGDLVRLRPDGRLDFIGRRDHQVKLRGFRIELGEVETALCAHPAVREAAVVVGRGAAADGESGEPHLAAYWTPSGSADGVRPRELRDHLERTLPRYMVPARWVRLDEMPRTLTGKVDREALPDPAADRSGLSAEHRAPSTPTERALAALWRELLGCGGVGADDDLFELGGHSLVAMRIAARVRDDLGVELPPEDLFEHSTLAALAARIDELAGGGSTAARAGEPPPIVRRAGDGPAPLAFQQEQIWLISRLEPDNLAYNFQYTVRLRGSLDRGALHAALDEIVRRHEVLRTTFPALDGTPVQRVHPPWRVRVPAVDLASLPAGRREAESERLVGRLVRHRFDVTELPLVAWRLLRLGPRDHLFVQAEQHFVHDGWSIGVFLGELEAIYAAVTAGPARARSSPLPELPIQYADYAVWQREGLAGEAFERQLAWWRERLADPPAPLELPGDRPRPRRQSFRGDRLDVDVPPDLYRALLAAGRREGATLFMLMTAAFEALLARYTGRDDFLLGSGVANRRHSEVEPLIGMIVNTLVLRADVSGDPTLSELVRRVRTAALGLQAHQDLPFEKLVAELQPERDLSRNPLFQHMFSFHDAPVPDLVFAGLEGELVERHNGSAKADFNVIVKPRGSQRVGRAPRPEDEVLRVLWEFNTDLFDRSTVERMWRHYLRMLRAVAERPAERVSRVALLTPGEERELAAWNDTVAAVPEEGVLAAVAARAADTPGAPAVVGPGGTLTYGRLAAEAGRLAWRLAARGVGPETVVAVALPASPETAVALVGVLAAGGAYLPLDPEHPADRLAYVLADSRARVLVTTAELRDALPPFDGWVLTVPPATEDPAPGPDGALPHATGADRSLPLPRTAPHPDALAYVIYTSGSTGRPKGTAIPHRGLANLVAWHRRAYGVRPGDRATLVASPAFDASVWELWPYLASGAVLHVPPPEVRRTPRELLRWLAAERIDLAFLPTPLAEAALEEELPADLSLRALLTGGDRLHRPPARPLPFQLVNHYGPTEDSVVTTCGEAASEVGGRSGPPPIGRPIANARVHLVDRDLARVPVGVPGELAIAGDGLARGYLRRPGPTAAAFVPDPFAEGPGGRLYLTGDLARYRPDGEIDFLGRIDDQVQVRGFRIELGEIESLLEEHPAVRHAAVVAVGEETAGLAGFVVAAAATPGAGPPCAETHDGGAAAERLTSDLRAHLEAKLPGYMVPAALHLVGELPLTPNGKVDRRALAAWAAAAPSAAAAGTDGGTAPRGPTERAIAEIWSGVLGIERPESLGADDDFFALGGHSLSAARAAARVGDAFGIEVGLAVLFERPTVAGLAAWVEERLGDGGAAARVPRRAEAREPRGDELPLSYAQQRLWLVDRLISRRSAYHVARAFACRGPLDRGGLAGALAGVVARHEALRTALAAVEGAPRQRVAAAGEARPRLPLVDLSGLAEAGGEERRLLRRVVEAPFDLARPPLLRAALVRRTADDHLFALVLHHVAADGWSLPIVLAELGELYAAARAGRAARLPALPVQYGDFTLWQRERLAGPAMERLLGFWTGHLAGAPPVLDLPTDRPRPAERSLAGAAVDASLDAETTATLRRLGRERGATLFMVLLAGYAAVLGRWAAQRDVVVGTPVAARLRPELEGLVGFFVNTLPIRVTLPEGASFGELVDRVRATTLAAYAHQEMPFERLVERLAPQRDLGHSPLFQASLSLAPAEEQAPPLAGLAVAPVELERRESHFELILFAGERGGGGLDLRFRYDLDLFDRATVERLAGHLVHTLAGAAARPATPLAELPPVSEEERRRLKAWNAGPAGERGARSLAATAAGVAAATGGGLHQPVAARGTERPEATAVVCGDASWTYGRLARTAHRIAHHLRSLGVGPETRVAVCLERSPRLVAALLGVLEAGGAYVALDPAYPEARTAFTLEDSGAAVVLTERAAAGALPAGGPPRVVLDEDGPWSGEAERPPAVRVDPDQLAYVLYTSGSTGRPKGVAIPHRGALALVRWSEGVFSDEELAGVVAATSVCFDLSVFELWVTLARGGRVILVRDALAVAELGPAAGATLVNTVPSAAAELLAAGGLPPTVHTVCLAGEPLPARLAAGLHATGTVRRVLNLYGPSEDTTYSTWAEVPAGGDDRPPAIGRPIAGSRAHLLDERGRQQPIGVPGELCLAGEGLARGYLGRPGRTAASFIPDPFSERPGGRLYRTGDLARHRPAAGSAGDGEEPGELVFLGRRDRQVKLRGVRIELGEVEGALAGHPAVAEAVAAVREEGGDARLVAYWTAAPAGEAAAAGGGPAASRPAAEVGPAALRDHLAARLPAAMVPAAFVRLGEVPRLPNGKVDRDALPAPPAPAEAEGRPPAEPATPTEERLAGLWTEVLPAAAGGSGDDFFALGGHSLLAFRLLARIEETFGVDLPLATVFRRPTLAGLAAAIDDAGAEGGPAEPPAAGLRRVDRSGRRRSRAELGRGRDR